MCVPQIVQPDTGERGRAHRSVEGREIRSGFHGCPSGWANTTPDVAGCILHSDRGSQFRARKAQRVLTRYRMVGSMGQVGSAGDNAAMESFFALVQKNILNRRRWATRDDLRIAIVTWIERTYNRRRRQAALGRMTPAEYEMIMTPQTTQAAYPNLFPDRATVPGSGDGRWRSESHRRSRPR